MRERRLGPVDWQRSALGGPVSITAGAGVVFRIA